MPDKIKALAGSKKAFATGIYNLNIDLPDYMYYVNLDSKKITIPMNLSFKPSIIILHLRNCILRDQYNYLVNPMLSSVGYSGWYNDKRAFPEITFDQLSCSIGGNVNGGFELHPLDDGYTQKHYYDGTKIAKIHWYAIE